MKSIINKDVLDILYRNQNLYSNNIIFTQVNDYIILLVYSQQRRETLLKYNNLHDKDNINIINVYDINKLRGIHAPIYFDTLSVLNIFNILLNKINNFETENIYLRYRLRLCDDIIYQLEHENKRLKDKITELKKTCLYKIKKYIKEIVNI